MNVSGSVLSGETKEFSFKFKSDVPGTFMESWVLHIRPKLPVDLEPLTLKGVAILEDKNRDLRDKLTKVLDYREMMRGVDEAYETLVLRACETPPPASPEESESVKPSNKKSPKSHRKKKRKSVSPMPTLRSLTAYGQRWAQTK